MTTENNLSGPTQPTMKRLFALSGSRCAFPECRLPIVQAGTVTGEICHIRGRKPGAARYDARQTARERHGYENLILLCRPHHTIVDADTETYSVEHLLEMKALHEQRVTAIPDAEAEHAAALLMMQSVTSVNQIGGITAHTVNIISQPSATKEALPPTDTERSALADYTFVANGGEQIAHTPSLDQDGRPNEFVYWHRAPTAWLRIIPSVEKAYGRAALLQLVEGTTIPVRPFGGGSSTHVSSNERGVVTIGFDGDVPETIATRITQVFLTGQIWAHNRVLIDPKPFKPHGTCRIPWPTLKLEFEYALANYMQFAKQSLQLQLPITVVAGLALVKNAQFVREKIQWFTEPPKIMRCLEQFVPRHWTVHDFDIAPERLLEPFYEAVFDACTLDYAREPRVDTWPR